MTGRRDIEVESGQQAGDPGDANAGCQPVFEARDRRLRQAAAAGESSLAHASLASDLVEDLAEHPEGFGGRLVDRPEIV